jgi:hypothetical protein
MVFIALLAILLPIGARLTEPSGSPRVTLLPTSDGITWLIEDGAGRRIIVGGGETDSALSAFSDRTSPWDRRVDLLVLPPPFRQHLPGATDIVRHTTIARIFEIGGPGEQQPARYDPWQLATLDRRHVPERIWGQVSVPMAGATLDLIAPDAPDGVPLRLPQSPPKPPPAGSRPQPPASPETAAAPGGYLRLTNGAASVLIALGTPDATIPGFAHLIGPTLLIVPQTSARTGLAALIRPWAMISIADGTGTDADGLTARSLVLPLGHAFTVSLDGRYLRLHDIPEAPAWAVKA